MPGIQKDGRSPQLEHLNIHKGRAEGWKKKGTVSHLKIKEKKKGDRFGSCLRGRVCMSFCSKNLTKEKPKKKTSLGKLIKEGRGGGSSPLYTY